MSINSNLIEWKQKKRKTERRTHRKVYRLDQIFPTALFSLAAPLLRQIFEKIGPQIRPRGCVILS